MQLVHMDERAHDRIAKLSKGQRQRVGLAQALLHDPDVLILDEPTVGLDPRQIIEVRELIRELGATRTVILSTHILPEVSMLCNRVVIIKKGKVVAVDTPEGLTSRLQGSERVEAHVLATAVDVTPLLAVPGVVSVEQVKAGHLHIETVAGQEIRPQLAQVIVAQGWGLLELHRVTLSLEEIFLELTTQEEALESAVVAETVSKGAA
jgi:ABC-2 type transport system ATP-binding protein